jgi:hypothetical protein
VNVNAGVPATYTIQVSWEDVGLGVITHQMVVQVPNI